MLFRSIFHERVLIEQIHDGLCFVKSRVVLIHNHEDQVKYLQSADDSGDADEEDSGRKQRNGDIEELLNPIGSVNVSGLIIVSRNLLKSGKEQNHVITDDGPDTNDSNTEYSDLRIGNPLNIAAEHMIQKTKFSVEQPSPYHCHCSGSCNHGKEEDSTVSRNAFHFPVQQNCQNQRDCDGERNFHNRILKGVQYRLPYLSVSEQTNIVLCSDENVAFAKVAGFEKALPDGLENRNNIQDNKSDISEVDCVSWLHL